MANPWFESWSQAGYSSVVHVSETLVCGTNYEFSTHTVKHARLRSQWAPLILGCALLGSPRCVPFSVSCEVLTSQPTAFMFSTCVIKSGLGYCSLGTVFVSAFTPSDKNVQFPTLSCHARKE